MGLQVLKFGGTSVGSLQRIAHVAQILSDRAKEHQVIAVLSAMSGETDALMEAAHHYTNRPKAREMDLLLSVGEQKSVALMSICLEARGVPCIALLADQVRILTNQDHTRARILEIDCERIQKHLGEGQIVLIPGFQGVTIDGDLTTLGRGGSDTSAVAIAAALGADACEIFTDVEGVYTTDPNIVPQARKLSTITFDEMLELASLGAKVLQTRSVEFAKKYDIPIHVRSAFKLVPGTWVRKVVSQMESLVVSGITYTKNEAKVVVQEMPDRVGLASELFEALGEAGIVVDVIVQNVSRDGMTDISFTVLREELPRTLELLESKKSSLQHKSVRGDSHVSKVSVIGNGMRSHAGVAAKTFRALADAGISIQMISTSEIKISCVVDESKMKEAVNVLHSCFELDKIPAQEVNDFVHQNS